MKTKLMMVLFTMLFALAMMAQTTTQAAPAAPAAGDKAQMCPGCDHDKCPLMKDGKLPAGASCCGHNMANMKPGDKCPMMSKKDGKAACCGGKCPMMKKGGTPSAAKSSGNDGGCCDSAQVVSCCRTGAACCKNGDLPCCVASRTAA